MTTGNRLAIAVLSSLVLGCSTFVPVTPSANPESGLPAVLTIDARGDPPVIIEIATFEAIRLPCGVGGVVQPGEAGVPPLPWDLRVVTQGDGRVLLATRVTELPRWLTIFGDEAGLSMFPVAGPPGPSCPPTP
jgi:hypothetical protein